jgi:hypothetical protein
MYRQTSNIIRMSFKRGDFFMSVVVEHPQLEIIRASDEPILACDKFDTTYWDFCDFKGFDYRSCFMVVDVDCAVVEACQKPGFCGMEIDAFNAI